MHTPTIAAMAPTCTAATFNFCHASRSARITTAILVSNCMVAPVIQARSGIQRQAQTRNLEIPRCAIAHLRFAAARRPGMTIVEKLPLGVAGPGADHAFLAAGCVAFAGRLL